MAGSEPIVELVGSGPAAAAIEGAMDDIGAVVRRPGIEAIEEREDDGAGNGDEDADLAVVVDGSGAQVFERMNRIAYGSWVSVELGGIGGVRFPGVDGAVSVLDPTGGCFACLRQRVESHLDESPDGNAGPSRSDARLLGAHAGRLAVSALEGESDPTGRVIELPYVTRRLLPVPGCSCLGEARSSRELSREGGSVPLEEAIERGEPAIDDRIGIIERIGEAHSFPAPYYLSTICETDGFSDVTVPRQAAGVAGDWNAAFMKAIGESIERYCAGVYRRSALCRAPAADLSNAVPPADFVLPDEGYRDPDPEEPIAWVDGENLHTGEAVRLPAEFVHFPPGEQRHRPSITTGLAVGTSGVGALLSGLYETIERDAAMLSWYSTYEPLELAVESDEFEALARRARSESLDVTALLLTQDIDVPVVATAVHRDDEWPKFAVGSAASLDPESAAVSALEEALQNWIELRDMGPERAAEESTAIGRYADFPPAAKRFIDAAGQVHAEDVSSEGASDRADELNTVRERVAEAGLSAYAASITTPDVSALGFEAVRVLVPAAQPLFTGRRYFGDRAGTVPRSLGFRARLDRQPHPYP